MKLYTDVYITEEADKISLENALLLTGSCFTAHIGNKLINHGFDAAVNPFGTMYNPESVLNCLKLIFTPDNLPLDTLVPETTDKSWYASTEINNSDIPDLSEKYNRAYDYIFISYGTPWVWELKNSAAASEKPLIVSNCHKLPASLFERRRLSLREITRIISETVDLIHQLSDKTKIIFTVSPVRYAKDGLIENTRSKALLHLGIENICDTHKNCSYFPSYELFIDEMRDYRFYSEDLLHPGPQGVQYVWERFCSAYIDKHSLSLGVRIEKSLRFLQHRSNQQDYKSVEAFKKAKTKATALAAELPQQAAEIFLQRWLD